MRKVFTEVPQIRKTLGLRGNNFQVVSEAAIFYCAWSHIDNTHANIFVVSETMSLLEDVYNDIMASVPTHCLQRRLTYLLTRKGTG